MCVCTVDFLDHPLGSTWVLMFLCSPPTWGKCGPYYTETLLHYGGDFSSIERMNKGNFL